MDIQQIEYFLEIVKWESFSEAAENLYTSQSSVSKNIKALEKELNVQLFDRGSRKIRLTEAGRRILKDSAILLSSYRQILQNISAYQKQQSDSVYIVSIPVMAQYNFTGLLADFQDSHPDIRLDIEELEGIQVLSSLENGSCDFAFMRQEHLTDPSLCECIPLFKDRLAAILPDRHPLSGQSSLSLSDLRKENFLLLNRSTLLYDQILRQCEKCHFSPNITYTGTRMENIMELAGRGRGISLMMQHAAEYVNSRHTVVIPLKENITSTVALVRAGGRQLSGAGQIFWDSIRAYPAASALDPDP